MFGLNFRKSQKPAEPVIEVYADILYADGDWQRSVELLVREDWGDFLRCEDSDGAIWDVYVPATINVSFTTVTVNAA